MYLVYIKCQQYIGGVMASLLASNLDETSRAFLVELFAEIELAAVGFARERVAEVDLPSQKLVVLRKG